MQNIHDPAIEGNYKVTRNTSVTTIIDHEDEKIQWACSTSIYTDDGEPETLKEAMTRPNGNLWKMSAILEVKHVLSRKSWIITKRSVVKAKGIRSIPAKWVFSSKE